ncbi:hypothetical protein POTOM_026951 [Populus tomentosa]|uniref:Uncharacterized protein n=1 Tax=Populus tomentosa TaxID=118781 RepID=A0A8X8CVF1_POPTO|nr:hypothetical protein POTOM_026951 [Populus tomentosa]
MKNSHQVGPPCRRKIEFAEIVLEKEDRTTIVLYTLHLYFIYMDKEDESYPYPWSVVETVTTGAESVIAEESAIVGSVIIPVAVRFVATSVMDSSIASAVNSVAASELVSAATRSVTG